MCGSLLIILYLESRINPHEEEASELLSVVYIILPSSLIAVINTEHSFKTVQAGRVYERACCSGVRQDYALKSFEPGAAGAT